MSKITKYEKKIKALEAKANGSKKAGAGGKKKMGPAALILTELGVHSLAALASKTYDTVGPIPVKPDILIAGISGLAMVLTKKGTRQLAGASLMGSVHAIISRLVGSQKVFLGKDASGNTTLETEATKPQAQAA